MKKIIILTFINVVVITLTFAQTFPSWQLSPLYNWQDTTLTPSWQYDNTYNEIWGVQINGVEIAIIGSTAGTHFFDVTDPASVSQVDFVAGAYTGSGVIHRDYHDYNGYLYAVCDEGNNSTLQILDMTNLPNSVSVVYDSNVLLPNRIIFLLIRLLQNYTYAQSNILIQIIFLLLWKFTL